MRVWMIFLIAISFLSCRKETPQQKPQQTEQKPKTAVYILASKNFRDEEYKIPSGILKKNGIKVTVASSKKGILYGMLGGTAYAEKNLAEVNVSDYDAVIFAGGTGATEFIDNPLAWSIVREAAHENKVLGAICLAPAILAEAGVLKNKKATIYKSEKNFLVKNGAFYTGRDVETDGKIVTAAGPFAAKEFGYKILTLIDSAN